jgi:hypothetical protein
MKDNDVFTTSDVANICRVSTRIVTKWFDNDILDGYRLPASKHRRFTYDHVRSFMAKQDMPLKWLDEAVDERKTKPKRTRKKRVMAEDVTVAQAI